MHGKVLTVRHQAVNRRKDNRFAVALDSEQNSIHVKDIVKVIDGPHSVRTNHSRTSGLYVSQWYQSSKCWCVFVPPAGP